MPIEAKAVEGFNLEKIYGEEFRIPSIIRVDKNYRIKNLNLFIDWENSNNLKKIDIQAYCNIFDRENENNLNGQVVYDPKTNLITEISLDFLKTQSSRVYLEDVFSSKFGSYKSDNISDLSTAILYQEFLARYLSNTNDSNHKYPYIFCLRSHLSNYYGSSDLFIPKDLYDKLPRPVTDKSYQEQTFPLKAKDICRQFSTRLLSLDFDDEGFLIFTNLYGDASSYELSEFMGRKRYSPHNVNNSHHAATHHGIVAEFINDLIERNSNSE